MPLSKTTTTILNQASVAASSRSSASTSVNLTQAVQLSVTARCTFSASANDGAVLEIYASQDDASYDSFPTWQTSISLNAGTTVQITGNVPASMQYIQARVLNNDSAEAITSVVVEATVQNAS